MTHSMLEMPPDAMCLTCRYALRGLPSQVCPECGRAFNPHDPLSYAFPNIRRLPRNQRRLLRWMRAALPPSKGVCTISACCCAYLLFAAWRPTFLDFSANHSPLRNMFDLHCIAVLLWVLGGLLQLVGARRRLRLTAPALVPARVPRREQLLWITVVLGASAMFPWTLHLRFWASRTALERAAAAQLNKGSDESVRYIGLFRINGVYVHNGGQVFFNLAGDGDFVPLERRWGLLYEPRGQSWSGPGYRDDLAKNWSLAGFAPRYTLSSVIDDVWHYCRRFAKGRTHSNRTAQAALTGARSGPAD